MAKVTLVPLTFDDREQFIRNNQEAFNHNHWVFCTYDTRNQLGTHFLPCP